MLRRVVLLLVAGTILAGPLFAAHARTPLTRARILYNQHDFDGAIAAADDARRTLERPDSADLVAAPALLERSGMTAQPAFLDRARERLRRISPPRLTGRERIEFTVGLGEAL